METSLKTGFAQIFSCCAKNLSCPKFGGATAPLAPPARTPMMIPLFAMGVKIQQYFPCYQFYLKLLKLVPWDSTLFPKRSDI